ATPRGPWRAPDHLAADTAGNAALLASGAPPDALSTDAVAVRSAGDDRDGSTSSAVPRAGRAFAATSESAGATGSGPGRQGGLAAAASGGAAGRNDRRAGACAGSPANRAGDGASRRRGGEADGVRRSRGQDDPRFRRTHQRLPAGSHQALPDARRRSRVRLADD